MNVISIILSSFLLANEFQLEFKNEIERAFNIQKNLQTKFKKRAEILNVDYEICSSIIFPELVRYSLIRGKVEDFLLLKFYATYGSNFSNKSVGLFQMKPMFIEKLEQELSMCSDLGRFSFIWSYPKNFNEKDIREKRADRMLDLEWQIDYLISFVAILDNYYSGLNYPLEKKEKIATYSTGYNSGVWYDLSKINNYRSKKFFPSIYNFKGNRYNYSQISIYFFETFFKEKIDS